MRRNPTQDRARVTVDAILEATAQLLVADGPGRLTTNRIAERAGVSVGTLYQYFPDKHSIVRAVAERSLEHQFRAFDKDLRELLIQDPDPEDAVRGVIAGLLATKRMDPDLERALLQVEAIEDEDWHQRWLQRMRQTVRSAIHVHRHWIRDGDPDVMTYVIVTAFDFLIQDALKHRPHLVRDGRLADEIAELAIRYLKRDP